MFKRKVRNSINPSSSNSSTTSNTSSLNVSNKNINTNQSNMVPREPIFHTDIRTQNTRLVTPRQRQEIYVRAHHMFSRILKFTICNCFFDKNVSYNSRILLVHQLWSFNLSNENINTGVCQISKIVSQNSFWHFNLHFVLKAFI